MRGKYAAKVEWVGNPLRDDVIAVASPRERFAGRSGALKLLVLGGSLGAVALNQRVPAALALLPAGKRPRVTHQAGEKHVDALCRAYADAGVESECVPFIADIAKRYAEADLVICRGGASTVAELAAVGIGSVIVPLPGAIADEQTHNARFLVEVGAALLIPQSELTAPRLVDILIELDRERLLAMAIAARSVARVDASERVADACIALAQER